MENEFGKDIYKKISGEIKDHARKWSSEIITPLKDRASKATLGPVHSTNYFSMYQDIKSSEKIIQFKEMIRSKCREMFDGDVFSVDISKYKLLNDDWGKMIDYYQKGTNENRIIKATKSIDKILSRYVIAGMIGWDAAAGEFKKAALGSGVSLVELEAFKKKVVEGGIPEKWIEKINKYKESGSGRYGHIGKKLPSTIDKMLIKSGIVYSVVDRAPKPRDLDWDSQNGRIWTLCYTMTINPGTDESHTFDIAVHTDEGGDPFIKGITTRGYVGVNFRISAREFVSTIEKLIKK